MYRVPEGSGGGHTYISSFEMLGCINIEPGVGGGMVTVSLTTTFRPIHLHQTLVTGSQH